MRRERAALAKALSQLNDAVRPYQQMDADVGDLVESWQGLTFDQRQQVGKTAPKLVDRLLAVEYHWTKRVER